MEPSPSFTGPPGPNTFWRSLQHAWNGLIHTVTHQRNMRMHFIAAFLVAQVGQGVPLGLAEKVTMLFCVMLIFFAEMLNSALEQLVDLAIQQFDVKAKLTKDMAAAGVLVLAIGTITIFAAILVHNAETIFSNPAAIERQVLVGVPITVFGGALMHERKKPWWLDLLFGLGAVALWVASLAWTESYVFWSMTLGLLTVTGGVAVRRQRGELKP
ncbi:MAG: diacylglycerol kinase family protein [Archangium sp.]|nr:diacylglycerol kinase family protein [Archangium sp.]